MGNSTVSHCRLPVSGNINGQFFQNHRWLITPDPVSEPRTGLQIDQLCDGFDPGIQILMPPQKRATPGESRARSAGNTFRPSDSQIFDLILKSPCAAPSAGCSVSSSEAINFRVQRSGPVREKIGRDNLLNFMAFWE